jgi:hypothetical protein
VGEVLAVMEEMREGKEVVVFEQGALVSKLQQQQKRGGKLILPLSNVSKKLI